jgi:hypothetical protein
LAYRRSSWIFRKCSEPENFYEKSRSKIIIHLISHSYLSIPPDSSIIQWRGSWSEMDGNEFAVPEDIPPSFQMWQRIF